MSENAAELRIGKGIVSFKQDGETDFLDLGFVPVFQRKPNVGRKPYYTAREGIKSLAVNPVTSYEETIDFTMSQINATAMAYFGLAEIDTSTPGQANMTTLTNTQVEGILKCVGTNDIGLRQDWIGRVQLGPSGTFDSITDGDDFSKVDLAAFVIKDDTYGFGKTTVYDAV